MGALSSDYFIHTLDSSCSPIRRFKINGNTFKGSNSIFILHILSRGVNCYRKQFSPLRDNSSIKVKPLWKDTFSRQANRKLHKLFPFATLVTNIDVC